MKIKQMLTSVAVGAAALALVPGAAQADTVRKCKEASGDSDRSRVCLYTNYDWLAPSNDIAINAKSVRMLNPDAGGYRGIYDLRWYVRKQSSDRRYDSHQTGERRREKWRSDHNALCPAQFCRVYTRFKIDWMWWPDQDVTITYVVGPDGVWP